MRKMHLMACCFLLLYFPLNLMAQSHDAYRRYEYRNDWDYQQNWQSNPDAYYRGENNPSHYGYDSYGPNYSYRGYSSNRHLGDWDYKENWRYARDAYYRGETQPRYYRERHPYGIGGIGYDPDPEYLRFEKDLYRFENDLREDELDRRNNRARYNNNTHANTNTNTNNNNPRQSYRPSR